MLTLMTMEPIPIPFPFTLESFSPDRNHKAKSIMPSVDLELRQATLFYLWFPTPTGTPIGMTRMKLDPLRGI